MDDIRRLYEEKFNSESSKVLTDEFFDRHINKENAGNKELNRLKYSVSKLYGNVLDVGSADGSGAYLMSENKNIDHITCLEIQDKAIEKAKKNLKGINNIEIIKGIAEKINYPDNSFDSIHCGATLEHVMDDEAAVREISRVAKDLVVFSVPIRGGISLQHVREYASIEEVENLISLYLKIINQKMFITDCNETLILECKKQLHG